MNDIDHFNENKIFQFRDYLKRYKNILSKNFRSGNIVLN